MQLIPLFLAFVMASHLPPQADKKPKIRPINTPSVVGQIGRVGAGVFLSLGACLLLANAVERYFEADLSKKYK